MAREPFEGSVWGERGDSREVRVRRFRRTPEPEREVLVADIDAPPRRRARWVYAVIGAAMAIVGVVVFLGSSSLNVEAKTVSLNGALIANPFERMRESQRDRIREAMTAPFVLGIPRTRLEAIAECESHGDPRAIGGGGLYRGKYQFHRSTWASVGGTGDPARASELEQDRRAAMLLKRSGSNPWPICG